MKDIPVGIPDLKIDIAWGLTEGFMIVYVCG